MSATPARDISDRRLRTDYEAPQPRTHHRHDALALEQAAANQLPQLLAAVVHVPDLPGGVRRSSHGGREQVATTNRLHVAPVIWQSLERGSTERRDRFAGVVEDGTSDRDCQLLRRVLWLTKEQSHLRAYHGLGLTLTRRAC